jgi:hypothetical protein
MQSHLFIGGHMDGMNAPVPPEQESIHLPIGFGEKENYVRDAITVGDASIAIFRHESLTSEQALKKVMKYYKAWAANQPGGR